MSEVFELLDRRARDYMRMIIEDMVRWRKKEIELLIQLVNKNARRLQDTLALYQLRPKLLWRPRAMVENSSVESPEGEPFRLEMVWPKPTIAPDVFVDKVSIYAGIPEERTITKDGNVIYKEIVLTPSELKVGEEELPKYPFFDNLRLSPAEAYSDVLKYLTNVIVEFVADKKYDSEYCEVLEQDTKYRYICRAPAPDVKESSNEPKIPLAEENPVDFQVTLDNGANLSGYYYYAKLATDITFGEIPYPLILSFIAFNGYFSSYSSPSGSYGVHLPAYVVVLFVLYNSSQVNVENVVLRGIGVDASPTFKYTQNTQVSLIGGIDLTHRKPVKVVPRS